MGSIEQLRLKRRDLNRLATEILSVLEPERLATEITSIRLKLSEFVRKLGVHLVVEDRFVYERLLRHSSPDIVTTATDHQRETDALRDRTARYAERWISNESAMEAFAPEFIEATRAFLDLACKRLEVEDRELDPLIDEICNRSGTWPLELLLEADDETSTG